MPASMNVDSVGNLISSLGSPLFGTQYFDIFRSALSIDQCTVFAFKGAEPPIAVVLETESADARGAAEMIADEYATGGFEHDPNLHRRPGCHQSPAVFCMRAEELKDQSYRRRFYDEPHLAHELILLAETANTLYYSSFFRRDPRAAFSALDLEYMLQMARFALATLDCHSKLVTCQHQLTPTPHRRGGDVESRGETLRYLREVLLSEPHLLSPREAEVCAGIILGYTTVGISLNFGFFINTVATHRKRAYRKLGISSQNELFSRYFRLVSHRLTGTPH